MNQTLKRNIVAVLGAGWLVVDKRTMYAAQFTRRVTPRGTLAGIMVRGRITNVGELPGTAAIRLRRSGFVVGGKSCGASVCVRGGIRP